MIISTKGRYALRVMVDLAQHQNGKYIPLKEIAERQEISEKYLESVLKVLVKEKFLLGLRGKGGGYMLNRPASQITAWDVISLTENNGLAAVSCLGPDAVSCPRDLSCSTLPMWQEFEQVVREFFSKYTIEDLAANGRETYDYVI